MEDGLPYMEYLELAWKPTQDTNSPNLHWGDRLSSWLARAHLSSLLSFRAIEIFSLVKSRINQATNMEDQLFCFLTNKNGFTIPNL